MTYKLPITAPLLAAIEEATDAGGVPDLTDADRLALYLQTLALAADRVAERIHAGDPVGTPQVGMIKAFTNTVIAATRPAARPEAGDPCPVCGLAATRHLRGYNCNAPAPSNVNAVCPGCGASFVTADPIDPAARCLDCVSQAEDGGPTA